MQLDPLPDTTPQAPLKRGPGRPRKQRPASSEPASPVDTGPRVTDRFGAARIVGKSIFFIKGLEKRDPGWPKPFAIGGFCNNYLIADICKYLEEKAAKAQAATGVASKRPATPGEMRRLENLIPGSKAKTKGKAASETA
jgi:hypothetical protein